MKNILLVQHCQSEHHINNMTGGWTDTPLTELGRQQAERIALRLSQVASGKEYVLYSSDLLRAKQTADIINATLELAIIVDGELREINSGIAAGQTREWANEHRNPRAGHDFELDYREFAEGETWREFYARVSHCMERITRTEHNNIIIVTHGGTLSYIIAWWLKFELHMLAQAYFPASAGSLSRLGQNNFGQQTLNLFNDTSHLQG
ncbi:histidine phosphatase family protein [Paenibacillus sp. LMG 31459]|uniref:Histidine phosphatase family protein n=1 Tax=Paenibacillus phytohabitans TaxID=2654978 RepID=A0ABX1YLT8_9BACL|nr:histidine phosphatase family protein [Paenibacillus phytohabitans]NOU81843.1 histidine phosphatase family protein [Paenibacillus phytohabitans]